MVMAVALPRHVREVHVPPLAPSRFKALLDEKAWKEFEQVIAHAHDLLAGRVVWNLNSTPAGGGVAEMLRSFVSYARGAGLDTRWGVIEGTPEFFRITKRIHNFLHGNPGDGGELGETESLLYSAVTAQNADDLAAVVRRQDVLILHDPQTAGLVPRLKQTGAAVVWRSHVGAERANAHVDAAWAFLKPYLQIADVCVFSRRAYVPASAEPARTEIIQPSIDAMSPKNQEIDPDSQRAILAHTGLVSDKAPPGALPLFTRQDGSPGRVDRRCEMLSLGQPPDFETPLIVQVSRWDRLKDPAGVMLGFARHVSGATGTHLILAGPEARGVADDPEGVQVLNEMEESWRKLPEDQRRRVHLACLPMTDIDENAAIVNALQRHASVVVQKSIEEGFGLTVSEAMWKSRPVVASAVGGIQDQIEDGVTGVFLKDPRDLEAFGAAVTRLVSDPSLARDLGERAREHVRSHFLVDRHARQYVKLLSEILA